MYILGWALGSPYPSHLESFFHSDMDVAEGGNNTAGYNNPVYDALCDQFLAERDIEKARQDAYGLQVMVADDLPYLPLLHSAVFEAYRSDSITFPYTDTIGGLYRRGRLPAAVRFVPAVGSVGTEGGTVEGQAALSNFPGTLSPIPLS